MSFAEPKDNPSDMPEEPGRHSEGGDTVSNRLDELILEYGTEFVTIVRGYVTDRLADFDDKVLVPFERGRKRFERLSKLFVGGLIFALIVLAATAAILISNQANQLQLLQDRQIALETRVEQLSSTPVVPTAPPTLVPPTLIATPQPKPTEAPTPLPPTPAPTTAAPSPTNKPPTVVPSQTSSPAPTPNPLPFWIEGLDVPPKVNKDQDFNVRFIIHVNQGQGPFVFNDVLIFIPEANSRSQYKFHAEGLPITVNTNAVSQITIKVKLPEGQYTPSLIYTLKKADGTEDAGFKNQDGKDVPITLNITKE